MSELEQIAQNRLFEPVEGVRLHVPLHLSHLDGEAVFERPCDLKEGFRSLSRLDVGAYSYSWSLIGDRVRSIGRYCSIGARVTFGRTEHPTDWLSSSGFVYDQDFMGSLTDGARPSGFAAVPFERQDCGAGIRIGHDVWIGDDVYIRGGVRFGDAAIIGTYAVVTRDVPDFAIVAGNPARVVKSRFDDAIVQRLTRLRWWDYNYREMSGVRPDDIGSAVAEIESAVAAGLPTYKPPATMLKGNGTRDFWAEPTEPRSVTTSFR